MLAIDASDVYTVLGFPFKHTLHIGLSRRELQGARVMCIPSLFLLKYQ
jgi:hypothetical protein